MIIFSVILLVISFLLQGFTSNFLSYTINDVSIFSTIYVLITLMLIYPYFENKKKYLILLVIFGWLVDIVYCNTFLLNISIFFVVYKFNNLFHFFLPDNLFTLNVSNLLGVFIYHMLSFLLLSLLRYGSFSFMVLGRMMYSSIIMTIVYTTISYFVIKLVRSRIELKEVK